jgi:hypothetical protein
MEEEFFSRFQLLTLTFNFVHAGIQIFDKLLKIVFFHNIYKIIN